MIETDVLVIGCGPAGLTATMALARQGIRVCAITKYSKLAPTPRAHVTNQRTFEVLRDFGIEAEAMALATDYAKMPNVIFLRSFMDSEFGRIKVLLSDEAANKNASPCVVADLPQNLLEPVLFQKAVNLGANIRFSLELQSFTQDDEGVTAHLSDRLTGESLTARARYMIGADGGKSKVAEALELPFEGPGKLGGSLNVFFDCDLAPFVEHRPGLLYMIVRSAQDNGGPGLGILRCIKPWTSWLLIKGYAAGQETPHLTQEEAADVIRDYLGIPELKVRVRDVSPWDLNARFATLYQRNRVFCVGDAVHRHAPSNGLGSNTGVQDAYNLAWKLALVLKGKAGDGLLHSYSEERVPIGRQVVTRATTSLGTYPAVLEAIGVLGAGMHERSAENIAEINSNTSAGAQRRAALQASIHEKIYEFQTRGVELNQTYRSSAIIDDGQRLKETAVDLELLHHATTCPGAKLPHAWVQRNGRDVSTLDLVGNDRFTLLTGIGGEHWIRAASAVGENLGIGISTVKIGPGCPIEDLYFEWAERRETAESGCLIVRPDGYVAWRCHSVSDAPLEQLARVFHAILDRS
jgi:2,4-dichlorophenol 6-monooxygenase